MSKIETKVTAGSLSAAVAGVALWLLQTYAFKHGVPAGLQSLIYLAVPGVLALVAGYFAPHTPKPSPAPVVAPPAPSASAPKV